MANTTNIDIDYISKDFNSTVDNLINFATINYGSGTSANRLWTNFNQDSFSRNWLEIVAYVSDLLFFYFDTQATQAYLQTASVRSAVNDIAKQFGFTPATESSASGDIVFTINAAGTISRGFRVKSTSGLQYYLTNSIVAGSAGTYTGTVLQGIIKTENFTATGLQNEELLLSGPNVVLDQTNTNTLDISPAVTVNGNSYKLVSSFLRFNGTDVAPVLDSLGNVIGGGGRVFTLGEKPNGTPFIKFGDGIFGRKVLSGESISVTYRTGGGSAGNVSENSVVTLVDSNSIINSVTNPDKFSGGADEQSIDQLRELIPASLRTLERAVAEQDYSDILIANFSEIFAASTEVNSTDPGIDINVYVVPNGIGIPKISDNTLLKNRLSSFLNRRKMVTVQFQILDAFPVDVLISLEVFISNTASRNTTSQAISTTLLEYFSLITGGAGSNGVGFAEEILLKDITDQLRQISGIDRFEIKRLTYRPRVEKNIVGLSSLYNVSDVSIYPNVQELEWLVGASGSITKSLGAVGNLFDNADLTDFVYESNSGEITYLLPVDLSLVSPGDLFRNGPGLTEITRVQTVGEFAGAYEISEVTAVADNQGKSEITKITTVADVSGTLASTYFTLYDEFGSVAVWFQISGSPQPSHGANRAIMVSITSNDSANTVATQLTTVLAADTAFSATRVNNEVTITLDDSLAVPDAVDFNTTFDFDILQKGENRDSLDGTYFNVYDDSGLIKVWYDVDNTSTPPSGVSLLEVDVLSNDSATAVATKTATAITAAAYNISATSLSSVLTISNDLIGNRTNASDFNTGFDIETITNGTDADSLSGTYFDLNDQNGPVRVWFDLDNASAAPATPIGGRRIEVDIAAADTANNVATKLRAVLNADAQYNTSGATNLCVIEDVSIGTRSDAVDVNTGFTISIDQQGVANNTDFTILGVDLANNIVTLSPDQPVNPISGLNAGGSIRNGTTSFESFKVFKKILASTTNLSSDSITDSNLDLTLKSGSGTALNSRTLLDNTNVYLINELSTGDFYLLDSASNVWEIISNDSNTIRVGITAVNNAAITSVSAGAYKIVKNFTNKEVIFHESRFLIQYNTNNTFYSVGSLFNQIGTIGDDFQISETQTNVGNLGVAVDLISYDSGTKKLQVNGSPNLVGVSSQYKLIDNSGQIFNLTAIDNRVKASSAYNALVSTIAPGYVLENTSLGSQYAQGIKVEATDTYTIISLYLKRQGNVTGGLTARIVNDDGTGLPNSSSTVAVSTQVNINTLPLDTDFNSFTYSAGKVLETAIVGYEKIIFSFNTPPELTAEQQYHIIINGNAEYNANQNYNIQIVNNSPFISYGYDALNGIITYDSDIDLSTVLSGHYFVDGAGKYFIITSVNDDENQLTIGAGKTVNDTANGHVYSFDSILIAVDVASNATYADGKFSRFDGTFWANDTQGPVLNRLIENTDSFFTLEGPKSFTIDGNLTPSLGVGATLSQRYYDDNSEISFILGFADGLITSAVDVNPVGKGTVGAIGNSKIDSFSYRTSAISDDIVNLRKNEIPQLSASDISITIFGGV